MTKFVTGKSQAGKHVYVEKPLSHNPREGEILVEAALQYGKSVQMGNQRRSWPKVKEAITANEILKTMAIARILLDNVPNLKAYWVTSTVNLALSAL